MKIDNQVIQHFKELIETVPDNERDQLEKLINQQFLLVHFSFKVVGQAYFHKNFLVAKRTEYQESPSSEDFKRFYQSMSQEFGVSDNEIVLLAERPLYLTIETFLEELET